MNIKQQRCWWQSSKPSMKGWSNEGKADWPVISFEYSVGEDGTGEKLPWWWFPHRCSCPTELIYGYQMKSLIALSRTALLRNTRRLRIFFRFLRKIDAFENIIFLRINQGGRLPNRRHVTCLGIDMNEELLTAMCRDYPNWWCSSSEFQKYYVRINRHRIKVVFGSEDEPKFGNSLKDLKHCRCKNFFYSNTSSEWNSLPEIISRSVPHAWSQDQWELLFSY